MSTERNTKPPGIPDRHNSAVKKTVRVPESTAAGNTPPKPKPESTAAGAPAAKTT